MCPRPKYPALLGLHIKFFPKCSFYCSRAENFVGNEVFIKVCRSRMRECSVLIELFYLGVLLFDMSSIGTGKHQLQTRKISKSMKYLKES